MWNDSRMDHSRFTQLKARMTASGKTAIRSVVRPLGYDIVPFGSSWHDLQRRFLTDADLLVDVGANTGQYVDLVTSLGYLGPIVSFEPGLSAFSILKDRAAHRPNWQTFRTAIGHEIGEMPLNISANSTSSSLLAVTPEHVAAAPRSGATRDEMVPVTTLDAALTDIPGRRLWLKLDVQGYEKFALLGAEDTLRRTQYAQCELSLRPLYENQADYIDICATFRAAGLDLVHVQPGYQDPKSGRCQQMEGLFARPQTDPSTR